ncbi:hypothetical protein KPL74_09120 [Bacillus sp. NP157]|nr:hypothetical protein KPL74_09120 [Bacillus sp. NP157]
MRLEIEKKPTIDDATAAQLHCAIMALRSYGPSSFASLTDGAGNYVQVAGGGVTCMLERRDAATGRHFRGYKDQKSKVFPDGTVLVFGGGEVRLSADEWFTAQEVEGVFVAFLGSSELPSSVKWRDITAILAGTDVSASQSAENPERS